MSHEPLIKQLLQHRREFLAYLVAITRSYEAAEEVFQNAAVVVMEQGALQGEIRDFRAWAKEIVRRQGLLFLRKVSEQQRLRPIDESLLSQIDQIFDRDARDPADGQRDAIALRECLQQLEETPRTMVTMRYEGRATFAEIAQRFARTEAAVQRSLSRLRKRLHDCVRRKVRWLESQS